MLRILSVFDPDFVPYGKIVESLDVTGLLETLRVTTKKPEGSVIYQPSDEGLEGLGIFAWLRDNTYGGMPIQIGYCNGTNKKLNCLEYHRGSEVNIPADDVILLLAKLQDVKDGKLDTKNVQAFLVPAGTPVLLYETALHYAPCTAPGQTGFRVVVVLPRDTNTKRPEIQTGNLEDRLLWARNKWLIAHPGSNEASAGAFVGLTGENITL